MPSTAPPDERLDGPVHGWFELSYSNYLVLPRTLMQSMPEEWQQRMVACLDEIGEAFGHIERADCYEVTAGEEREVGNLDDAQLARLGITRGEEDNNLDEDNDPGNYRRHLYYDRDGNELESWSRVVWPTPDPVPHYNRGRTYIEPKIEG